MHVQNYFIRKPDKKNLCAFTPTNQRDSVIYNHWRTSRDDLRLLHHLSKLSKFNSQVLVRHGSSAYKTHIYMY